MNYRRDWTDLRNAVGFAAECARLALPFYHGDQWFIVAAIETAERYVGGEKISYSDASAAVDDAHTFTRSNGGGTGVAARAAARTAANAIRAAGSDAYSSDARAADANAAYGADNAAFAGVDTSEIRIAYARWVTRDLAYGRELSEELRQAAGAAIVAGDEDLARELVQGSR